MSDTIEYADIPEQPGALSRIEYADDNLESRAADVESRLQDAMQQVAESPSEPSLADQLDAQGINNDDLQPPGGDDSFQMPTSNATVLESVYGGPGKPLQYPSEALSENNNWIMFNINTYSKNKITEASDLTTPASANQLQGSANIIASKGLDIGELKIIPGKKRLKQTITLYMPHQVSTAYGMQWGEMETGGVLGTAISSAASGANVLSLVGDMSQNLATKAAREGIASAVNIVPGGVQYGSQLVQKATRKLDNPRKELLFQGNNFRQFQYSFLFTPRDEGESNTIKDIIKLFKLHMHPEISTDDGGMYMNYPDEFDIEYRHKDTNNEWMHKILTCVLENMNIDYAPFGQFATFENGAPVAIQMNLQFKEIEPLHRGQIDKGY